MKTSLHLESPRSRLMMTGGEFLSLGPHSNPDIPKDCYSNQGRPPLGASSSSWKVKSLRDVWSVGGGSQLILAARLLSTLFGFALPDILLTFCQPSSLFYYKIGFFKMLPRIHCLKDIVFFLPPQGRQGSPISPTAYV